MPRFSVITATFNSEKTITAAIKSLNAQKFTDFEHIVIDGGSTDGTVELVKQTSKHLIKIISEPDNGIYDALNKGIKLATGDYIGFLHSDDMLDNPSTLQKLANQIDLEQLDAIYADLRYVDKDDTSKVLRHWKSGQFQRNKLKSGWMPPHPSFYMKRSLYLRHGAFDTSFQIAADYDSMLRYLNRDDMRVGYMPEVAVNMRIGGASNKSIKNILTKSKEDFRALANNGFAPHVALLLKNLRKVPQFFERGPISDAESAA